MLSIILLLKNQSFIFNFFLSINVICKLVSDQNYVLFVFLHQLFKKFHQIIILLHVFFITLFIYSLSFVFHLVCNQFMFSLCTLLLKFVDSWLFHTPSFARLTMMICFVSILFLLVTCFFCKGKKENFRNIKIKEIPSIIFEIIVTSWQGSFKTLESLAP